MQATEQQQEEKAHELKPQLVGGLTDTVFGVAITLLAGALSINSNTPTSQVIQQLGGFAASFLIIAIIWLRRFQLLRWMRVEPAAFTRLNFALLALVVSYTYVLRLFTFSSTKSAGEFAFFLFALLSALVWGVVAALAQVALHQKVIMSRYRQQAIRQRNALLLTCAGFFVVAGLVFLSLQIASFAMIAAFSVGRLYRLVLERRQRRRERENKQKHDEAYQERQEAGEQSPSQREPS